MSNRNAGRPRKHVGLVPVLKQVSDGSELRDLRPSEYKPEGSVLQEAPEVSAPQAGEGRVFGPARGDNGGRSATSVPSTVLDSPGRTPADDADITLTGYLKKIGLELDIVTQQMNLEVLARAIWKEAKASNLGSQRAREMIAERLEGKAVRGEKPPVQDTTIEDQLERTEADLINSHLGKKE
jgi:hypothetical protein